MTTHSTSSVFRDYAEKQRPMGARLKAQKILEIVREAEAAMKELDQRIGYPEAMQFTVDPNFKKSLQDAGDDRQRTLGRRLIDDAEALLLAMQHIAEDGKHASKRVQAFKAAASTWDPYCKAERLKQLRAETIKPFVERLKKSCREADVQGLFTQQYHLRSDTLDGMGR